MKHIDIGAKVKGQSISCLFSFQLFGLSPGVVRLGTLQSPWPIRRSSTVPEGVLLGVGNPLLDLTIRADQDFLDKYGLRPNDAIIAKPIHEKMFQEMMRDYSPVYIAGGATQNAIRVAQWILRRPKATVFFGCVGADAAAEILWKKAEEAGVQVCYQVDGKRQTGLCGSVITGEDRSLVARLGAADYLTHMFIEEAPNWARVQAAQCFYISGFVFPVCSQSIFDIAAHACDAHKIMAMNLSAPFLCKYYADTSWDIMPYIDVLFGNEMEAALFGKLRGLPCDGLEDIARATALLPKLNPKRPRTVVFTGGRRPTVVARGSEVTVFPVEAIDPALIQDTNGCGDAFVGGFLAQLVQGHSLEESLRCGNYCAKVVIQHWGCAFPQQHDYE